MLGTSAVLLVELSTLWTAVYFLVDFVDLAFQIQIIFVQYRATDTVVWTFKKNDMNVIHQTTSVSLIISNQSLTFHVKILAGIRQQYFLGRFRTAFRIFFGQHRFIEQQLQTKSL